MGSKCVVAGLLGATVGSVVTYFIVKRQYKQLLESQIKSVEDAYRRHSSDEKPVRKDDKPTEKESIQKAFLHETTSFESAPASSYTDYNRISRKYQSEYEPEEDSMEEHDMSTRIIEPEEFGMKDGYTPENLYYHPSEKPDEDILEGVSGRIDRPRDYIGTALDVFWNHPECRKVYVRNPMKRADYCIIIDENEPDDATDEFDIELTTEE